MFRYGNIRPLASILATFAASIATPLAQPPPPPHRVLVIPINLPGRAPLALDRTQITQALFAPEQSVASRYRTISYGQLEFAGSAADILDPINLPEPPDFCTTGLQHLAAAAQQQLRPHAAYQHFVYVIPTDAPCAWTGVADIGGNRVWVKATTAKALQHELGHNLGMNHAVHWNSPAAEASDFMGSGAASLNAPHIIEMGWLQAYPAKVINPTAAAEITLEPLEADPRQSALPKVAIVRPAPDANTYFLSYRASSPANPLPDEFTRGLNIHIADPARHTGGLTYLVTTLTDGATYADGPLTIRQLSHTDRVTFRISFAGPGKPIPAGPPPAPPGTLQSLASGKCLDLPAGRTADGTQPIQYDCHGGPNQQWTIDTAQRLVSRLSGKCLGTDTNRHIVQSQCGNSPTQLWALEPAGNGTILRNAANQLCLDVPGASVSNGAAPIAWPCNGGPNQTWRYVPPITP